MAGTTPRMEGIKVGGASTEQAVIGSSLVDERAATIALGALSDTDFLDHKNAEVFRAMKHVRDSGMSIDLVSVLQRLEDSGTAAAIGGMTYLVECAQSVPTSANIDTYVGIVLDASSKRKAIASIQDIILKSKDFNSSRLFMEIDGVLKNARADFSQKKDSLPDIVLEEYEEMGRRYERQDRPILTGIREIDSITGGLARGEMWVIGARPSVGKSSLAMQMAENVVLSGKRAVFFSAEMSRAMIAQRFFSSRGVSASRARSGNLMDGDWDLASTALQDAQKLKNLIVDAKSSNINGIFSRVYREKFCEGLDFCIVDYLQILSSVRRYDSRNLEVAATSAALKSIAKDALIPIVVLSQLSRDSEKRVGADRYPRLSDLRDSGGIEQDADVVALLSEAMDADAERVAGPAAEWLRSTGRRIVRIEIAKNRNGPTGVIYMVFDGSIFRFVPIEESFMEGNFGGENAHKVEK